MNEWFELTLDDIKDFKNNCQHFENLYNISHNKKNKDFQYLNQFIGK